MVGRHLKSCMMISGTCARWCRQPAIILFSWLIYVTWRGALFLWRYSSGFSNTTHVMYPTTWGCFHCIVCVNQNHLLSQIFITPSDYWHSSPMPIPMPLEFPIQRAACSRSPSHCSMVGLGLPFLLAYCTESNHSHDSLSMRRLARILLLWLFCIERDANLCKRVAWLLLGTRRHNPRNFLAFIKSAYARIWNSFRHCTKSCGREQCCICNDSITTVTGKEATTSIHLSTPRRPCWIYRPHHENDYWLNALSSYIPTRPCRVWKRASDHCVIVLAG